MKNIKLLLIVFIFILNNYIISCSEDNIKTLSKFIKDKYFYKVVSEDQKKYFLNKEYSKLNINSNRQMEIIINKKEKKFMLNGIGVIGITYHNIKVVKESDYYIISGNGVNPDGSIEKKTRTIKIKFNEDFGEVPLTDYKVLFYITKDKDLEKKIYEAIKTEFINNFRGVKNNNSEIMITDNNKLKYLGELSDFEVFHVYNGKNEIIDNYYILKFLMNDKITGIDKTFRIFVTIINNNIKILDYKLIEQRQPEGYYYFN